MLKLHGIPLSNCYNIVKQAMLEKGIPFQEISQPPSQDEAFLAISPMGKIPCIETPGGYLAESLAIIEYLEETHPVPKLYPAGTFDRARAREIIKIAELYLDAPARRLLGHVLFGAPLPQAAGTAGCRYLQGGNLCVSTRFFYRFDWTGVIRRDGARRFGARARGLLPPGEN
jgi:glutathione S-transferase